MVAFELSPSHGWVGLCVAAGAVIHNMWMGVKVGQARKKYNVAYPALYAPPGHKNEKEYNCVQRAHQNSLENLPGFFALLLTAGLRYPVSAAIAGAVYLVGKIVYFNGYSTGDPAARQRGAFSYFGYFGLLGMVVRWSIELLKPTLNL
ncbi:Microsomal glutathione S-transferase 3 [Micractinium conductrix]|uniref:Glutathione S-transferase 3, mitochondrial n=1 Tax=Micractinium conductrix TaxID=554055 RepID=A0A2P6VBF8_9CHLO|nr:Microsomal glutathione S-transferase 3 [Micractinium conductrix]|eukprot:PSC71425.1 Microsomal glutathione S-transferase 3 [Micractinium conductrix]